LITTRWLERRLRRLQEITPGNVTETTSPTRLSAETGNQGLLTDETVIGANAVTEDDHDHAIDHYHLTAKTGTEAAAQGVIDETSTGLRVIVPGGRN
jgi:hypothetical protein